MRKSARMLAALLAAVMTLGLMGCGGGKQDEGSTGDGSQTEKTVLKIQWIGDFSQEDSTDSISGKTNLGLHTVEEMFEADHPDVDVQFVIMGWDDYQKKTQTMMLEGQCDVYQVPGISALAEQGLLVNLEDYIARDNFDLNTYIDKQVEGWKCAGVDDEETHIYGLPLIADTRVICYDKAIFDQWGVPYLSDAPTVEEVLEAAHKMTGTNPVTGQQNYGLFYTGKRASDTVMNLNEYYGGVWGSGIRSADLQVNFDTDTMATAMETMKEINSLCPEGTMSNQGGELFATANNNIAIHLRAQPLEINNIDVLGLSDQYGVARLFINEKEGMGGMFAGSPIAIAESSKNKDLAWEWIKFTASEEFARYFWENQRIEGLPVIKAVLGFDGVAGNENLTKLFDSLTALWAPRYYYRSGQGNSILTTAVEDVVLNGVDVYTALSSAQAEMDEWIAAQ